MYNTTAFYRLILPVVASVWMIGLQAGAAAAGPNNAIKVETGSKEQVSEEQNILAASNRSVTRHALILGDEKLAYTATAGSLASMTKRRNRWAGCSTSPTRQINRPMDRVR